MKARTLNYLGYEMICIIRRAAHYIGGTAFDVAVLIFSIVGGGEGLTALIFSLVGVGEGLAVLIFSIVGVGEMTS